MEIVCFLVNAAALSEAFWMVEHLHRTRCYDRFVKLSWQYK